MRAERCRLSQFLWLHSGGDEAMLCVACAHLEHRLRPPPATQLPRWLSPPPCPHERWASRWSRACTMEPPHHLSRAAPPQCESASVLPSTGRSRRAPAYEHGSPILCLLMQLQQSIPRLCDGPQHAANYRMGNRQPSPIMPMAVATSESVVGIVHSLKGSCGAPWLWCSTPPGLSVDASAVSGVL